MVEKAIEIVKDYFVKLKHADVEVGNRKLIYWLNFDVITAKEEKDQFVIKCEILENLYSQKKERYKIVVNKEGTIIEVEKENSYIEKEGIEIEKIELKEMGDKIKQHLKNVEEIIEKHGT